MTQKANFAFTGPTLQAGAAWQHTKYGIGVRTLEIEREIDRLRAIIDSCQLEEDSAEAAELKLRLGSLYAKGRAGTAAENYQKASELLQASAATFLDRDKPDEYSQCESKLGSLYLGWATISDGQYILEYVLKAIYHLLLGIAKCPPERPGRLCLFHLLLSIAYRHKVTEPERSSQLAE